ncbi:MAG TPA: hypothetical protein DIU35_01285 [Candidatus Latescibacteria bacterium]|nr:hypothetical protein [Candidatus Latescibacterota bacterium]|tara:strand:- start:939 stop:1496 length:558 start_codon:yes stop_codon:yes gene_type:complete
MMCWLAGVALILSLFRQGSDQVVISEVMFDPEGREFYNEFIELQNVDDIAVDLDGWRVGDGNEVDALVARDQNTLLSPCGCALLLDSSYFHNSDSYQPLPADVIVLAIEDATFGKGGFQNEGTERVLLVTTEGDTVGSALYVPGNPEGFSEEKIDPSEVDHAKELVGFAMERWHTRSGEQRQSEE